MGSLDSRNQLAKRSWEQQNVSVADSGSMRLPPWSEEAEQGALGSILIDSEVVHDVMMILREGRFYSDQHETIFRSMRRLYGAGKPIDVITLSEAMKIDGTLEKIGGFDALTDLSHRVPHSANARTYAQIIEQNAVKRDLIHAASEVLNGGYSADVLAEDLLADAEKRIFAIAEKQTAGETVDLRDVLADAMQRIFDRADSNCPTVGLSSGYGDVDMYTGGFRESNLVIVAARPSMGKTAFALNLCENASIMFGKASLFISLEMSETEIVERLLTSRSQVLGAAIQGRCGLSVADRDALSEAYGQFRKAPPIFIDDSPARNMMQIAANARRCKMRHDISLVVVDYIQLVEPEEARESRQEQVAKISRRLKQLARELDVPIIALSQLNRAVENREDRRPRMADLRESGAIEQDADQVLLLHRPDYYDPNDKPGLAELVVAKNRNGGTGSANLTFRREVARFESYFAEPATPAAAPVKP